MNARPAKMLYDLYNYLTNMPSWHILTGMLVGYVSYYFIQVVKVSCIINY